MPPESTQGLSKPAVHCALCLLAVTHTRQLTELIHHHAVSDAMKGYSSTASTALPEWVTTGAEPTRT